MKYSDFHLYTVAKGQRFIDAAYRCAASFVSKNPGLKFTVFIISDGPEHGQKIQFKNIHITHKYIKCPEYFTAALLMRKPCADILFFKYADAPFMLEGKEKYIGQVDADSLCMCKLPIEHLEPALENGYFVAAGDPKREVNVFEIECKWNITREMIYFNSGVCFWPNDQTKGIFEYYKSWVLKNIEELSKISYADQTWMNIYMNQKRPEYIQEIGYYWNMRGTVRHPRAYIWHAGGRDSEGIEVLKREFESWEK